MPNIFEVKDPRGLVISCSEERWNDHILTGHSDMKGKEARVKEAIEKPDAIYDDVKHPDRRVYYQKIPNKNFYQKVVVRVVSGMGEVITAFPADKPKAGENIIWKRSKL